jgi:hypothetical protein
LIWLQARETRRAAQGEAMLNLLLMLQEESQIKARAALYDVRKHLRKNPHNPHLSDEELRGLAPIVEPALRLFDLMAILLYTKSLRSKPLTRGDWEEMIGRCWEGGKPFVDARRKWDDRPDLWKSFRAMGEDAVKRKGLFRKPPWWSRLRWRQQGHA